MDLEQISLLVGVGVALVTLASPLLRLNSLLTRLNALLDSLSARTLRCEDRLDELDERLAHLALDQVTIRESAKLAHRRLDERIKRPEHGGEAEE